MRNIKALGLALVAILAIDAMTASLASATEFTSEATPVNLTGVNEESNVLTITAGNTSCKEVGYSGTTASAVTSVTVTPSYPEKTKSGEQNCTSLGFPAVIDTNGCQYVFSLQTVSAGDVKIQCSGTNEITITAIAAGTIKCTIYILASQTLPSNKVTYTSIGVGATREITINVNVPSAPNSLVYKHKPGTGLGACTFGSATNGSFSGKATVTGSTDGGIGHVGTFLSF